MCYLVLFGKCLEYGILPAFCESYILLQIYIKSSHICVMIFAITLVMLQKVTCRVYYTGIKHRIVKTTLSTSGCEDDGVEMSYNTLNDQNESQNKSYIMNPNISQSENESTNNKIKGSDSKDKTFAMDGLHSIPTNAGFAGPGAGFEGGAAPGFEINEKGSARPNIDDSQVIRNLEDTDAFDAIDVDAIRAARQKDTSAINKITSTGVGDSSLMDLVSKSEDESDLLSSKDMLQTPITVSMQNPIRDFDGEYPYKLYRPGTYAREHIRITATKLADGRDFFYMDDNPEYVSGRKTRELKDPRKLPYRFSYIVDANGNESPYTAPEMRQDPLTGDWIPMATARMNRPITAGPTVLAKSNPLAARKPGDPYQDGEVPDTDYDVVIFENRFPSMVQVPGEDVSVKYVDGNPLWKKAPAAGRCEVICFGPDENLLPANLSVFRMRTVVEAWAFRTAEISQIDGIEQIFPFENHGAEIGVSLAHPHGQIYCYPFIAPRLEQELRHTEAYFDRTGGNLLKDLMKAELEAGTRVIMRNHSWVAYVPAAARWPLEVHVSPVRDVLTLDQLDDQERWDLAQMYITLLKRGNKFFDKGDGKGMDLPYIAAWHQAPVRDPRRSHYRLNLQFFSFRRAANKIKYLAGSESGMAAWVSDTTPELIAKRFHEIGEIDLD